MESYEVLRQAFKKVGCKTVAQELRLSVSLVHQWSRGNHGHSEAVNPLERMAQLVALTGNDELLDWLCAQRGGRFVRRSEMPSLVQRWWGQMKAEMERLLKAEASPAPPGGSRCRHRLPGGRCGFPHAARN